MTKNMELKDADLMMVCGGNPGDKALDCKEKPLYKVGQQVEYMPDTSTDTLLHWLSFGIYEGYNCSNTITATIRGASNTNGTWFYTISYPGCIGHCTADHIQRTKPICP